MSDTTFILVTGHSPHDNDNFIHKMLGVTNHGNIDLEFIDCIGKDSSHIFHHDYKIVLNSDTKLTTDLCLHIDHNNYKRRSVINTIMSELTGIDIVLCKKMVKSDERPFIYLDPKLKIKYTMTQIMYNKITHFMLLLRIVYEVVIMIFFN